MKTVALISILKPVNENRLYQRLALSLGKTNKYELNIIGLPAKNLRNDTSKFRFHFLKPSDRKVLIRVYNYWQILKLLLKVKPDLVVITSPELLPTVILLKWVSHYKLIYDVQEDYLKNITFQRIYIGIYKLIQLVYHGILHALANRFVDHFLLAERIYSNELTYKKPFTILENKVVPVNNPKTGRSPNTMLFTGIVSDYSGINETLTLYMRLREVEPSFKLVIAGYAPERHWRDKLIALRSNDNHITLLGVGQFLDHQAIVEEICKATFGIVFYRNPEVSKNRIPTKLFEYLYYDLPVAIPQHSKWLEFATGKGKVLPFDLDDFMPKPFLDSVTKMSTSPVQSDKKALTWMEEEPQLIASVNKLLDER